MHNAFRIRAWLTCGLSLLLAGHAAARPLDPAAPSEEIARTIKEQTGLKEFSLQPLQLQPAADGGIDVRLVIGGRERTAHLEYRPVVTATSYILLQPDGSAKQFPLQPDRSYSGQLDNDDRSRVAVTKNDTGFSGVIIEGDPAAERWWIQPASSLAAGAPADLSVVYPSSAVPHPAHGSCGVEDADASLLPVQVARGISTCTRVYKLGMDIDPAFTGGNSPAVAIEGASWLLNAANAIFLRDVNVRFTVASSPLVRTASIGSYRPSQLETIRNDWNANRPSVDRDVVQLFTGAGGSSGPIGISYFSTFGRRRSAYAVSFPFWSGVQSLQVGVVAHELGHTMGATHCDGLSDCSLMCSNTNPACYGAMDRFDNRNAAINIPQYLAGDYTYDSVGAAPPTPVLTGAHSGCTVPVITCQPVAGAAAYRLLALTADDGYQLIQTLPAAGASPLTFTDATLPPGTSRSYVVDAVAPPCAYARSLPFAYSRTAFLTAPQVVAEFQCGQLVFRFPAVSGATSYIARDCDTNQPLTGTMVGSGRGWMFSMPFDAEPSTFQTARVRIAAVNACGEGPASDCQQLNYLRMFSACGGTDCSPNPFILQTGQSRGLFWNLAWIGDALQSVEWYKAGTRIVWYDTAGFHAPDQLGDGSRIWASGTSQATMPYFVNAHQLIAGSYQAKATSLCGHTLWSDVWTVIVQCGPADMGSAGGVPGPDGALTNDDHIVFTNFFFAGDPRADLGSTGGVPGPDGQFDNNDFIVFFNVYFAGCP